MEDVLVKLNSGLLWKNSFKKMKALFTSKIIFELKKKLVNCYIWGITFYGAETWTLRAIDHLESFEMWCWRRMEKTSWTDLVRNQEVFLRIKEPSNILHEINKRKAKWFGHNLLGNCFLQQGIEGKIIEGIEVTGRRGRRRRKLLNTLI
jgi:hypothetical protein